MVLDGLEVSFVVDEVVSAVVAEMILEGITPVLPMLKALSIELRMFWVEVVEASVEDVPV